jgi:hypothetical protein
MPGFEIEFTSGHEVQLVAAMESEYLPSGQDIHIESPSSDLKVPASHSLHNPSLREKPLTQKQSLADVAPGNEVSCSLHMSEHSKFPDSAFKDPGSHGAQTEPSSLTG